ncbi:hypothetical protein [Allohahella marinimesophila]|uniref:Permease YjgP/YjgQ family protein n=1 Tax=Allohahella marinimesophila TaxID=1054972 RepID=A0ABP7PVY3_9GAMM
MNIEELYSVKIYDVLSDDTQRYATTSIQGSGDRYRSEVSSTTEHHTLQAVWVKDSDTGKEQKLNFDNYEIDVRPGHRILIATNKSEKRIERVINLSTDDVRYYRGVYNRPSLAEYDSLPFKVLVGIAVAAGFFPIFGAFGAIVVWLFHVSLPIKGLKKYILVLPILYIFSSYLVITLTKTKGFDWDNIYVTYVFFAWLASMAYLNWIKNRIIKVVTHHSNLLDAYLSKYLSTKLKNPA